MEHKKPHPEFYGIPFTSDAFHGMGYRVMGRSGLRVSHIGLGAWKIGYPETGDGARVGEKTAMAIFDRALELGVTFWDTANRYNNAAGNSERIIGAWFKNNPDQRRNIILATKIFGGMDGISPNHCRLSRNNVLDAAYACLGRLGLEYIDVLYFHAYDPVTPIEESLSAVEDLVRRDLVRYFGVSNYSVDQIRLYQAVEQSATVRTRMITIQNRYDILNGELPDHRGVLDYAARMNISYVAESPLALGFLTDRYLDLSRVGPGDRLFDEGVLEQYAKRDTMDKLHQLAALAKKWDLSVNQLALAYMLTLPGMGPVIPSASSVQHLESNAAAGQVVLTNEQKNQIEEVLGRQKNI